MRRSRAAWLQGMHNRSPLVVAQVYVHEHHTHSSLMSAGFLCCVCERFPPSTRVQQTVMRVSLDLCVAMHEKKT